MSATIASANQTSTVLPQRVRIFLHGVDLRVFIGNMPAILQQPNCPIYWDLRELIQIKDNVWFHPSGISQANLLQAAGHNPRKIDYAVPQEWFELPETQERIKAKDKPMWSYEAAHDWGAPLWMSELLEDLKREILTVLPSGETQ